MVRLLYLLCARRLLREPLLRLPYRPCPIRSTLPPAPPSVRPLPPRLAFLASAPLPGCVPHAGMVYPACAVAYSVCGRGSAADLHIEMVDNSKIKGLKRAGAKPLFLVILMKPVRS